MTDLYSLLPHARKDAKFDKKSRLYQLNELAELQNCNNVCYFEGRKAKDVYLWLSRPPNGPTVKFHLQNRKLQPNRSQRHLDIDISRSTHDVRAAFSRQLS